MVVKNAGGERRRQRGGAGRRACRQALEGVRRRSPAQALQEGARTMGARNSG